MKMGTNQQFSLRWNNYVHHITCAFDSLRSDEDLVDVTLSCEGRKILAHKMLLSACSTYFKNVFKENPCKHPVIIFRNVRFEDLVAIVDFMYHGEVNVEQEQLSSFLTTAEMLAVQGLTDGTGPKDTQKEEPSRKRQQQQQSMLESSLLAQDLPNSRQQNHHHKTTPRVNPPQLPAALPSFAPPPSNRPTTPTGINRKRKFSPVKVLNNLSNRDGTASAVTPIDVASAAITSPEPPPRGSAVSKKRAVAPVKEESEVAEPPLVPKLEVVEYEDNDSSYSDHESGMMDVSQLLEKGPVGAGEKDVPDIFTTNSRESRDSPHPSVKAEASDIDKDVTGIAEQAILKPGTSGNVDSMQETYIIAFMDDEDGGEEYLETIEDDDEEVEEIEELLEEEVDDDESDGEVQEEIKKEVDEEDDDEVEEGTSYVLVGDIDGQGENLVKLLKQEEEGDVEYIYAEGVNEDNEIIIGEVPQFSCKFCSATFKRLDSLYKHNSVHMGKTKCPVCNAVFSRVAHRTRHLRLKHPEVELTDEDKPRRGRRKKAEIEAMVLQHV